MVWYKDIPIVIIWLIILILILYRYGKGIVNEIKNIFRPILQNKLMLSAIVLSLVIMTIQITLFATKPSYFGNAAFEPDQCMIVDGTLRMVKFRILRPYLLSNPPFVFYIMYPLFAAIYFINPETPFNVYITVERISSIFIGILIICILFNINNLIFKNRKLNILSLVFISINGLISNIIQGYGRYIDVMMIFWLTLAIYYCIKSFNEKKMKYFNLAIIFCVFSISSKLPGILSLVFLLLIILPIYVYLNKMSKKETLITYSISIAISLTTFFVINPYYLIEPVYTFEGLFYQFSLVSEGYLLENQSVSIYFVHYFIYQGFFATILDFLGYIFAAVLIGFNIVSLIKKKEIEIGIFIIASLAIGYFIVYPIFFSVYMVRYSLPAVQFSIIAFFIFIDNGIRVIKNKWFKNSNIEISDEDSNNWKNTKKPSKQNTQWKIFKGISFGTAFLVIFLILSFSVVRITYLNISYQNDTRHTTGDWMINNIDNEAVILASAYVYIPEEFSNTTVQWGISEEIFNDSNPEYLIISSIQYERNITELQAEFYINLFNGTYNVTLIKSFQPDNIPSYSAYDPINQFKLLDFMINNQNLLYGPTVLIYQVNSI